MGLWFGNWGLRLGFRVQDSGFRVQGSWFRVLSGVGCFLGATFGVRVFAYSDLVKLVADFGFQYSVCRAYDLRSRAEYSGCRGVPRS